MVHGSSPDISGDRLVYVGADAHEIRTCLVGSTCDSPETIISAEVSPCSDSYNNQCGMKFVPRTNGDILVWLDNRESFEPSDSWNDQAIVHLYAYDFGNPVEGGTRVSTTAWQSNWSWPGAWYRLRSHGCRCLDQQGAPTLIDQEYFGAGMHSVAVSQAAQTAYATSIFYNMLFSFDVEKKAPSAENTDADPADETSAVEIDKKRHGREM